MSYADKRLSLPLGSNGVTHDDDGGWKTIVTTAGALSLGIAAALVVKSVFS